MSDRRTNVSGEASPPGQSSIPGDETVPSPTPGSVAHVRLDGGGRVQSWNQVAADLLGYETKAVVGMPLADLLDESVDEAWVDESLDRAARRGQIVEDVCHVRRDGTRIEATVTLAVALGADGEPSGYLYAIRTTDEEASTEEGVDRRIRRLQSLFEKSPDSIILHDANGEILRVNDQHVENLGYSREEVHSMNVADFDVGHDASDLRELWDGMETGSKEKIETEHRRNDGTTFPVEVWVTKIGLGGEPQFLAHGRNVTERNMRERELELALDAAEAGVWGVDLIQEELTLDERAKRLWGCDLETCEETIEELTDRVHPEDLPDVQTQYREAIADRSGCRSEFRVLPEDGTVRWIQTRAQVVANEDGDPKQIVGVGIDVTERKERERELQELSERFELAIDGANLAVWDWDLSTDDVEYNDTWATMLGYDPDDIGSDLEEWERRVHPDDLEAVKAALDEHIAEETEYYETEHRMKTASGDWKWIRDIGKVFERDDTGEPVRAVGIHIDIDDRKRVERTLREERDVFAEGPVVVFKRRLESEWPIEYVSSNVENVFGYPDEELVDDGTYADLVHPQDRDGVESAIEERSDENDRFDIGPYRLYDADGDVRWVRETTKIIREETGTDRYLGYLVDVTERKEREHLLERQRETLERIREVSESLRPINRALVRASTREEIVSLVCKKLAATDTYRLAWFGEYDPLTNRVTPESWAGIDEGYLDGLKIDIEDDEFARGQVARTIRSGEVHATRDIATDPAFQPWREAALDRGYRSVASIPVLIEGNVHGVITVYSHRPNAFETYERELLGELGERVGHAIQAAERRRLLHTDAGQELVFRTTDVRSPFVDVTRRYDCRLELQTVIPTTGNAYVGYMTVDGAAPEDVVAFFEATDSIEESRVISSDGDTGRIEYTVSASPVTKLLEFDVSVTAAVIEDGEEIVHGEVATDAATKPIVAGLQSAYADVELVAKRSVDRNDQSPQGVGETIEDSLTDRQREILSLAYQAGYFESPRRSTGDELADAIGIAAPTFYVHVRRGTRNILEQLDAFEILE